MAGKVAVDLTVQVMTTGETITVGMMKGQTIGEFKAKIQDKVGIAKDQLLLQFPGGNNTDNLDHVHLWQVTTLENADGWRLLNEIVPIHSIDLPIHSTDLPIHSIDLPITDLPIAPQITKVAAIETEIMMRVQWVDEASDNIKTWMSEKKELKKQLTVAKHEAEALAKPKAKGKAKAEAAEPKAKGKAKAEAAEAAKAKAEAKAEAKKNEKKAMDEKEKEDAKNLKETLLQQGKFGEVIAMEAKERADKLRKQKAEWKKQYNEEARARFFAGATEEDVEDNRHHGEAVEKFEFIKHGVSMRAKNAVNEEEERQKMIDKADLEMEVTYQQLLNGGMNGKNIQDAMMKLLKGIKLNDKEEKARYSGEMKMIRDDTKTKQKKCEPVIKEGHRSGSESEGDTYDDDESSESDEEC
jgi:hypothetical protein